MIYKAQAQDDGMDRLSWVACEDCPQFADDLQRRGVCTLADDHAEISRCPFLSEVQVSESGVYVECTRVDADALVEYLARREVSRVVQHYPGGITVGTGCGWAHAYSVASKLRELTGYTVTEHINHITLEK